jgi:exosortase
LSSFASRVRERPLSSAAAAALPWLAPTIAAAAATSLYAPVVAGVVRQWYDEPDTAYGAWLVAAAAFVIARRWSALRATPRSPSNLGFLLLLGALAVCAVGILAGDLLLLRASGPLVAAACLLFFWGTAHLKLLAAPLGLVLLALPVPRLIVAHLTVPLQLVASQLAASTLETLSVSVSRAGNLLVLPDVIVLEVAQACSGLQSVMSLVAVSAICAAVVPLTFGRGLLLLIAAVPVAIVGNGLRVAATALLTLWIGEAAVKGVIHELTGHLAFLVMCGAIVGLVIVTRSRVLRPEAAK